MMTKEQIATLCEEALADTDRFLVEVRMKPNNVIEVYIDSDTSVSIDHCAGLSRFIEGRLDRDAEDFELSVLSWGLSGALRMDRQLRKYLGQEVVVKAKETGRMHGKLIAFDDEKLTFAPAPKKTSKKQPAEEPAPLLLERQKTEIKPEITF